MAGTMQNELMTTHLTFPNESAEYREARAALLTEEMALRAHIEAVAAQRRALPPGGEVPEDYRFERLGENGMPETVTMSKLFGRHRTLRIGLTQKAAPTIPSPRVSTAPQSTSRRARASR